MRLTDYYDEMSGGRFWLWGDVYPSIVRTVRSRGYYKDQDSTCLQDIGLATVDILDSLDAYIDYSQYDRNPQDGYVDLIIMIYRSFRYASGDTCRFTGFAWLQGEGGCDVDTLITSDSLGGAPVKIDLGYGHRRPSGVTIEGQNLSLALQQSAHEVGHLFFHRGPEDWRFEHPHYQSTFGVMDNLVTEGDEDGAGMALSAFERDRLGWITRSTVSSTQLNLSLAEAFQGNTALHIPLHANDSTEFYLIENRAKLSWYDQDHNDLFPQAGCRIGTLPSRGAAIYHVHLTEADSPTHKLVDVETPSGLFELEGSVLDRSKPEPLNGKDTLDISTAIRATGTDTWGNGNANTFATYTSPNTNGYKFFSSFPPGWKQTEYTGVNVNNIALGGNDTLTLDVVFTDSTNLVARPSTGSYTAKWDGWLYLTGDVSVDSLVTVDVRPSTKVKSRYLYDKSAKGSGGGVDGAKVEIVVKGGGLLDVNGTSGSGEVQFTSTKSAPDAADWYGIRVKGNGNVDIDYANLAYGLYGVAVTGQTGSFSIDSSEIHHNGDIGVYGEAYADTLSVRNCVIHNNGWGGIAFVQKKSLAGTPYMWTKITGNRIYNNSLLGGDEIDLINVGGTGVQIDSVSHNRIGLSDTLGVFGVYSYRDVVGVGSHATIAYRDTITNFAQDALTFTSLASSRVRRCRFTDHGRAVVVTDGSTVTVDTTKFVSDFGTHVWVDTLTVATIGYGNALYAVPDVVMVTNLDSDSLKAEKNWWDYSDCSAEDPPPATRFVGLVDRLPWKCQEPSLARPPFEFPAEPSGGAATGTWLTVTPNPSGPLATIRYGVASGDQGSQGVEVAVFDVLGRRIAKLLDERQQAGTYEVHWDGLGDDGAAAPSGVYFVRLTSGAESRMVKALFIQ